MTRDRAGGARVLDEFAAEVYCARVMLAEAARRRHQHSFHATLLRWVADSRRRAAEARPQRELFGRGGVKHIEQIEWITTDEALPDDGVTVLMDFENVEPWLGWHDDGAWYAVDGAKVDGVIAWAHVPEGTAPLGREEAT